MSDFLPFLPPSRKITFSFERRVWPMSQTLCSFPACVSRFVCQCGVVSLLHHRTWDKQKQTTFSFLCPGVRRYGTWERGSRKWTFLWRLEWRQGGAAKLKLPSFLQLVSFFSRRIPPSQLISLFVLVLALREGYELLLSIRGANPVHSVPLPVYGLDPFRKRKKS